MKKTDDRLFAGYFMGDAGAYRRHMHYKLMVILIVFSFNGENSTAVMTGFSFRWYGELFRV